MWSLPTVVNCSRLLDGRMKKVFLIHKIVALQEKGKISNLYHQLLSSISCFFFCCHTSSPNQFFVSTVNCPSVISPQHRFFVVSEVEQSRISVCSTGDARSLMVWTQQITSKTLKDNHEKLDRDICIFIPVSSAQTYYYDDRFERLVAELLMCDSCLWWKDEFQVTQSLCCVAKFVTDN